MPSGILASAFEFRNLANGQTNFEDAVIYGVAPALITTGTAKAGGLAGAKAGAALGGLVGGPPGVAFGGIIGGAAGYLSGWYTGRSIKEGMTESAIADDHHKLRGLTDKIEVERLRGVRIVNNTIMQHFGKFPELVESHPHITNQENFKSMVQHFTTALAKDSHDATTRVRSAQKKYTNALPARNLWDKILFIDRPSRIAQEYAKIADVKTADFQAIASKLTPSLQQQPYQAAQTIKSSCVFVRGDFAASLGHLPETLQSIAREYDSLVNLWEHKMHESVISAKSVVDKKEARRIASIKNTVEGLDPEMKPLKQRIAMNCRRIGRNSADYINPLFTNLRAG